MILSIYGTLSAAFIALISFYRKLHLERVQTKNTVLYHLLEIRHAIKSEYADQNELTEQYITYCKNHFIKIGLWESSEPENAELKSLIASLLSNLLNTGKPSLGSEFVSSYDNTLNALSKDDPFLAHYLKGKEKLNQYLEATTKYSNELANSDFLVDQTLLKSFIDKQSNKSREENIKSLLSELDKDILKVAWRIDLICYLKSRWKLRSKNKPTTDMKGLGIDTELNKLLLELTQDIKQANKDLI